MQHNSQDSGSSGPWVLGSLGPWVPGPQVLGPVCIVSPQWSYTHKLTPLQLNSVTRLSRSTSLKSRRMSQRSRRTSVELRYVVAQPQAHAVGLYSSQHWKLRSLDSSHDVRRRMDTTITVVPLWAKSSLKSTLRASNFPISNVFCRRCHVYSACL